MKLIDILVRELNGKGGWPLGAGACAQDNDGELCFYLNSKIHRGGNNLLWSIPASKENSCVKRRIFINKAEDMSEAVITLEQYEAAFAASKRAVWSGDGLPPVGAECEFKPYENSEWFCGTVNYLSDHTIVMGLGKTNEHGQAEVVKHPRTLQFRPIRTEADRKRDEAIAAMRKNVSNHNKTDVINAIVQIYDAIVDGEIPGIKIE